MESTCGPASICIFMTVGHTKVSPDWCFGSLKQIFRRTKVDCLDDIVGVVESSASVNNAQLVGTQSGETVVKTYDWAGFFAPNLKRVPHIKKQHHFVFTTTKPRIVSVREFSDTELTELKLQKDPRWTPSHDFPDEIQPRGLSLERQWHLYDKIREYCSDETSLYVHILSTLVYLQLQYHRHLHLPCLPLVLLIYFHKRGRGFVEVVVNLVTTKEHALSLFNLM